MLDNTTLEVSAAENMASTSPAQPDSATDVGQEHQHLDDTSDGDDQAESPLEPNGAGERPNKPSGPVQKRRRVTRACDECRRKKIKCDGKQPCTHCTVYSYGRWNYCHCVHLLIGIRLHLRPTIQSKKKPRTTVH